jgi:hypothetical protein
MRVTCNVLIDQGISQTEEKDIFYLANHFSSLNIELRVERQLYIISFIDNIGRFVVYVGGNRSPWGKPTLSERVALRIT